MKSGTKTEPCGQALNPCGLWAGSPTTHVFLSEVLTAANKPGIPVPWSAETLRQFALYNQGLGTLAQGLKRQGWPIDFVPMATELTGLCAGRPGECGAYMSHPTRAGYERLAAAWFGAIQGELDARLCR